MSAEQEGGRLVGYSERKLTAEESRAAMELDERERAASARALEVARMRMEFATLTGWEARELSSLDGYLERVVVTRRRVGRTRQTLRADRPTIAEACAESFRMLDDLGASTQSTNEHEEHP